MRRLYIHIGLGKTGSSALQSWLSINAAALARQGFVYADLSADARAGKASSGNGAQLVDALRAEDFSEVERLLHDVYFPPGEYATGIISSELLKDIRPPKLGKLHALLDSLQIEPRIIAYVRSVYERAYSTYGQRVKMLGHSEPFDEGEIARSMLTTMAWLRKYQDEFGDALTVLNYDAPSTDIYGSFAQVTGIDTAPLTRVERTVNRSLSYAEQQVQRQLNALHGGDFSAAITRHLVDSAPDKATSVHYDPELLERTREVCADSVQWVNDRFTPEPPLVCDRFESRKAPAPDEDTADILRSVAFWATRYQPPAKLADSYRSFLAELVGLCGDLPDDIRDALATRAAKP